MRGEVFRFDLPALSERNQLSLGIILLDVSANAVTLEQAQTMRPLWQLLQNLQGSGTAADAEVSAVLRSIYEMGLYGQKIVAGKWLVTPP